MPLQKGKKNIGSQTRTSLVYRALEREAMYPELT